MKRLRKLKPGIVPKPLKIWFVIHFAVDVIFVDTYIGMLNLKIIWSTAAGAGTVVSLMILGNEGPKLAWGIAGVFFVFAVIWIYWRVRIDE